MVRYVYFYYVPDRQMGFLFVKFSGKFSHKLPEKISNFFLNLHSAHNEESETIK